MSNLAIGLCLFGSGVVISQTNPSSALMGLLEYGILGIAVVLLIIALIRKDRQANTLYDRLVEKSERDSNKYHELAEALNETLQELTEAVSGE